MVSLNGSNALVIDHSVSHAELLKIFLETHGASVTTVTDMQAGLAEMFQQEYDIAFVDLGLAELTNAATIETLRKRGINTPLIALTASLDSEEKKMSALLGFNDYLTKPFNFHLLSSVLKKYIGSPIDQQHIQSAPTAAKKVFERFAESLPQAIRSIKEACQKEDWGTVVSLTHRLNGTAGLCGFQRVAREASALHDSLHSGSALFSKNISEQIKKIEVASARSTEEFERIRHLEA